MACPFVAAPGANAGAGVAWDDRAGKGAGAAMARPAPGATNRPEDGRTKEGSDTGDGAIFDGAIAETRGLGRAPSRTASFVVAPGADAGAGLIWDARAGEGAGADMARPVPGATSRRAEGGATAGSATAGRASAVSAMAAISCGGSAAPSPIVPVGGDATADSGRTTRAGRLRAWPTAGSLSTRGLASRGQGMKPKWPAAANTAPPASSRPKAASAVDQRKPAARRLLARSSARRRCLIRSRSVTVSSSNGSAARTKDTSGPSWRFFADSVVSLSILMECFLAFSRQIIEKPSPCTMYPDPDGVGLDSKQGRDFCR